MKNKRIKTIVSIDEDNFAELDKRLSEMKGERNRSDLINSLLSQKFYDEEKDETAVVEDLKNEITNLKRMLAIVFSYTSYIKKLVEAGYIESINSNGERKFVIDSSLKNQIRKTLRDSYITFSETDDNYIKLIDEVNEEKEEVKYDDEF